VLSAEPLAGVCVVHAYPERRRWGSKERAQRDAGDAAHQSQENGRTQHIGLCIDIYRKQSGYPREASTCARDFRALLRARLQQEK
jgi:hypothetical protein